MDVKTREYVAIKKIERTEHISEKWAQRLQSEITAHQSSKGEHVCCFRESFENSSRVYVVMELCEGDQLFDVVARSRDGHLSEKEANAIFRQLLEGVRSIHDSGYIHRDLKPENIMCCKGKGDNVAEGTPWIKIVDFGAAKELVGEELHCLEASVSGTTAWNA